MQKTQQTMAGFQNSISKTMKRISVALGGLAIGKFIKDSTAMAMGVESATDNIARNMGESSAAFNNWVKTQSRGLGMARADAYKYGSTFSNLLSSFSSGTKETADQTQELMKAAAIISSKTGRSYEDTANRIRSGMLGSTEAIEDLGVYTNISMIQSTEAFKRFAGNKSWSQLSFQTQQQIRLAAILEQTYKRYGDTLADTTQTRQSMFLASLKNIQLTLGQAFLPIYNAVLPALTAMADAIGRVVSIFSQFTQSIFGKAKTQAQDTQKQAVAVGSLGDATEKAGKQAKGAITGFDEINNLADKTGDSDIADALGVTDIEPMDLGIETPELDVDTTKITEKLDKVKVLFRDIYENWGIKDLFQGFRDGLDLINLEGIKTNFITVFNGLADIANSTFLSLQPIFQTSGEVLGTQIKYGLAIAGNLYEPIVAGWADFTTNMTGPIKTWTTETAGTIAGGLDNVKGTFENIGQSWLNSINQYKPVIAQATSETMTNIVNTFMLLGTVAADTFKTITGRTKAFTEENKGSIQAFTDSIFGIFTDAWNLVNDVWTYTLNSLSESWTTWGIGIVDGLMKIVTDIGGWLLYLWNDLVKPIWDTMMGWLTKIWEENLKAIVDELLGFVGRVGELIVILWNRLEPYWEMLLTFVVPHVKNVLKIILDAVGLFINGIAALIKNLLKIINGIIDFVVGVFTLDWKRAWEGIKKIFDGIIGSFKDTFKTTINSLVMMANGFIRGWNALELSVPKVNIPLLGDVGGFTIGLPKIKEIPMLAKGGITNGPMHAIIGDNPGGREVVSPLAELMDMISSAVGTAMMGAMQFGSGNSSEGDIYIQLDGTTLARAARKYFEDENSRIGGAMIVTT